MAFWNALLIAFDSDSYASFKLQEILYIRFPSVIGIIIFSYRSP